MLFYLLIIVLILLPLISSSLTRFTYVPEGAEHSSLLSDYELRAVNDFLLKTGENTRIISDPFTMVYVSSYINHIALLSSSMPPFTDQDKATLNIIWHYVFQGNSSSEIYSNIASFKSTIPFSEEYYLQKIQRPLNLSSYVVIVSSRTAWWLDHEDCYGYYPLFPQTYNVTYSHIARFSDPRFFTPAYQIEGKIYVFYVEQTNTTITPIARGNVLNLSLDEMIDGKILDKSGFSNHAVVENTVLATGISQNALYFDGFKSYLSIADSPSVNCEPSFTVEFSFNPSVNERWMAIYKGYWTTDNSWYIYGDSTDGIVARFWFDGTAYDVACSYEFLNKWTHVAVVFPSAGKPLQLFINGLLTASGNKLPQKATYNNRTIYIGKYEIPEYHLSGFISEIRLYNTELTQQEIYNNFLCAFDKFPELPNQKIS